MMRGSRKRESAKGIDQPLPAVSALLALLFLYSPLSAAEPPITALAVEPTAGQLLAGSQRGLVVFDAATLDVVAEWPATMKAIHDIAFRGDGKVVAIVGGDPAEVGRIELRAWPSGDVIASADCGEDVVYSVAWDDAGERLVTGDGMNQVRVWRAEPLEITHELVGHSRPVFAAAFLDRGKLVVSTGQDQSLRVWEVATGKVRRRLDQSTGAIHDLALRPDNPGGPQWVATVGEDRAVRFWQPTIGRMIRFARLDAVPLSVCWMTGEGPPRVAVGCDDGTVRVIDAETLAETKLNPTIDGWCYEVVDRGNNRVVAAGSGGRIWRPEEDAVTEQR